MGFFRQEYWSGLPLPSPGNLPNPGIKPRSLALKEDNLQSEPQGKPLRRQKPLRKAEEPEIKLPTSVGSSKKQESSRKTSTSVLLTRPKPLTMWISQIFHKLWKIFKEMGIPDYLTCLLRNLYAGQEATVTGRRGTMDWFQIGKGVSQSCILPPCLFNLYAEYIMRNAGLDEVQAGIKISGRSINNLRYADDTTLMAESEEELKNLWWKWQRSVRNLA